MPTDLLGELTHEAVDSSRRRARYVKAYVTSLETEGPAPDPQTLEVIIREVVSDAARRGADGVRLWASLFDLLRSRPTRSSLVRLFAEEVVELAEAWLNLECQLRKLMEIGERTGINVEEVVARELDNSASAIAKVRAEAATIVEGLSRPRPEIDAARLAAGIKSASEGRALKHDEAIAAIRAARK
jgi:hypothetical protein